MENGKWQDDKTTISRMAQAIRQLTSSRWLWPLRLPDHVGEALLCRLQTANQRLGSWTNCLLAGAIAGLAPYSMAPWVGMTAVGLGSALIVTLLMLAAAARDDMGKGLLCLGAAFAAHSLVTIALAYWRPEYVATLLPDGMAYWEKTLAWLTTGQSDEYDPRHWLMVHAILIAGMALAGYPTLGVVPFFHGFHQLDLMNCYVGRLLAQSDRPQIVFALGWHPWSLLRGLGFAVLLFEVVSISLARLSGSSLCPRRRRLARYLAAFFLLAADATIKYFWLDAVRGQLATSLAHAAGS